MSDSTRTTTPPWLLVTRREVVAKMRDKTFLIGTAVMIGIIALFMVFNAWQADQSDEYTLVTTSEGRAMADAVAQAAPAIEKDVAVKVKEVGDAAAAEQALKDGDADAYLHPDKTGWLLTSESDSFSTLTMVVRQVVQESVLTANAAKAGTSVEELQRGAMVTTDQLKGDSTRSAVGFAVGFAFAFLFYLAALLFGMQLANSVIEEKQSRIVEIIAAAIPLRHLLAGKILGNTILALLQVTLYAVVALIGVMFTPYKTYLPEISTPVLWFLAFFVAGFIALACLWAVAGSLASRTEDLQSTTMPLTMLLMLIFFVGMFLQGRNEVIASFIPPLSAVVMPKRIASGGVVWWEPLIALALLGVFAFVVIYLSERVYRRALMQTGGKVSLRQAWSAAE